MAAKPGPVVEDAQELGLLPLSRAGEHGARALVKVQVPKAMDVGDFVRARLTHRERVAFGVLAIAAFAGSQQPVLLHEAADRHVARHRTKAWILACEREQVVVMELKAPAWVVAMLLGDRLGDRGTDAWVSARVRRYLARQGAERIVDASRCVPPSLDRLEREADGLAGGG